MIIQFTENPREVSLVPNSAIPKMSTSSQASHCFIDQNFSKKLQAFLIDYSLRVTSNDGIYK